MGADVGLSGDGPCFIEGHRVDLTSFDQLCRATPTSDSEIIQVETGAMRGVLRHALIGGLALGVGSFSRGLISRGVYSNERVTIGMLFSHSPEAGGAQISSDISIWGPGTEHQQRYYGGASFGGISVTLAEMARFFGASSDLGAPQAWALRSCLKIDRERGRRVAHVLTQIASRVSGTRPILQVEADFWKDAILDALTQGLHRAQMEAVHVPSPEKLVRTVQRFLDDNHGEPIHISRLMVEFGVSRRSLHRAFDEVLGIGPIQYLKQKRLCRARHQLHTRSNPLATIADVAFQNGFADFGRFAAYYRRLFEEYPSETVSRGMLHS